MWNFARTQTRTAQRSEPLDTAGARDLDQIFGNLFEPLEPPSPRREPFESAPLTAGCSLDAGQAVESDQRDAIAEDAAPANLSDAA